MILYSFQDCSEALKTAFKPNKKVRFWLNWRNNWEEEKILFHFSSIYPPPTSLSRIVLIGFNSWSKFCLVRFNSPLNRVIRTQNRAKKFRQKRFVKKLKID